MKTTKQLQDNLDTIFSKYIRLRDTDEYGYGKCITCGNTFHYHNLECGHFRKRRHLSVRWDTENAHAQCHECNVKDDAAAMMIFMLNKHGIDTAQRIIRTSQVRAEYTKQDYQRMYGYYRTLVGVLLEDKMFTIKY